MSLSTNTNAESDKCFYGAIDLVSKNSENFAQSQKCTQSGLRCRMTSLSNGDLETEVPGVCGYKFSDTSFYDEGWE